MPSFCFSTPIPMFVFYYSFSQTQACHEFTSVWEREWGSSNVVHGSLLPLFRPFLSASLFWFLYLFCISFIISLSFWLNRIRGMVIFSENSCWNFVTFFCNQFLPILCYEFWCEMVREIMRDCNWHPSLPKCYRHHAECCGERNSSRIQ